LIGRNAADPRHVFFADAERIGEGGGLAAEQRLVRPFHAARKLFPMALHVLVDRLLDEFGLLESGHQRGIADLFLRRLMNLDRRLCAGHSVSRY
jgi:hypothetical protein